VEFVAAYTAGVPGLDAAQQALAHAAASDGSVWLFSSSEAVANLAFCRPVLAAQRARWPRTRALRKPRVPRVLLLFASHGPPWPTWWRR
jgi:uroporphyrinogen-III synthase